MREALRQSNLPAAAFTVVLLAIILVGSGFAWWLNERVPVLQGNVPLMPRSEILKAEKLTTTAAEIFNYTCRTQRTAAQTQYFYRTQFEATGWAVTETAENVYQFERGEAAFRIVLHPQRFKTVYTLHMRHPREEE